MSNVRGKYTGKVTRGMCLKQEWDLVAYFCGGIREGPGNAERVAVFFNLSACRRGREGHY